MMKELQNRVKIKPYSDNSFILMQREGYFEIVERKAKVPAAAGNDKKQLFSKKAIYMAAWRLTVLIFASVTVSILSFYPNIDWGYVLLFWVFSCWLLCAAYYYPESIEL